MSQKALNCRTQHSPGVRQRSGLVLVLSQLRPPSQGSEAQGSRYSAVLTQVTVPALCSLPNPGTGLLLAPGCPGCSLDFHQTHIFPVLFVLQPVTSGLSPVQPHAVLTQGCFLPHSKYNMFPLYSLGLSLACLGVVSFRPQNCSNVNLD